MSDDVVGLGAWDYVLFAIMLVVSAAIGIYSACSGGRQRTADEYLLGNREMSIIPVALSMMVSYISAISVLGLPSEIYMFNTMFIWNTVGYAIGALVATQMFVPMFFELKLTSIYEYLELRFNKCISVINICIFFFQMFFYMGIVIYTPALALNAATGMSLSVSIISTGFVCIFYTTIGGMKAVLWTDTFQTFVMVAGVMAIIIAGTAKVGGFDEVWKRAEDGGRIVFFDMRPDLTIRNSFWSVNIGATMITFATYGMNQAIVQRCLSLGSIRKAKWAISLAVLSQWTVLILMSLSGVVMYAYYFNCDPHTQGKVFSPDQIMPYMVMEVFAKMPGIPGIFLSSVLSASLSTLSSGLNALAAVAGEDIFKAIWPNLNGRTYTIITKLLSFFFGLVAIGVAFLAMVMGDQVLMMGLSIYGLTYGAVVATFTLGFCCPRINYKGVLVGTIVSIGIMTWLKVGKMYADNIRSDVLPLSVEGCTVEQNSTNLTYYTTMVTEVETWTSITESSTNPTNETQTDDERTALENFYSLSYHLYGSLGFLITVAVAFIVSAVTG
ncbi:sodium-coupled monocarboxylate transporter 1-like [Lytechinus pictus]|uniref:sodium-coupled monocarboxylate transporter 1-like n=1 Tax=Lytechinus pictus TaxID=7653 RepID=UPI0030B9C940